MTSFSPKISVLMGVYNCQETLAESIDSIINQTYTNWELIICDDGSKDKTADIVRKYQEKIQGKIVFIQHESNKGLNETLNDCLEKATGDFIARMDGDDISLPERFEIELKAFEDEPDLAVVSCPMIYFDENGDWFTGTVHNQYPSPENLIYGTIHCHGSCIVKTAVMREVGGYSVDDRLLRVEDWHLWLKIYEKGYRGKNINEVLYKMRDDRNANKRRTFRNRLNEAYVSCLVIRTFHLPIYKYLVVLRPILLGLMPSHMYNLLHKNRAYFGL